MTSNCEPSLKMSNSANSLTDAQQIPTIMFPWLHGVVEGCKRIIYGVFCFVKF